MAGSGVILTSDLDRAIAERSQIWAAYDEASGHGGLGATGIPDQI